jgi:hypothetical protein
MKKSELKALIKECINEGYEDQMRSVLGVKPTDKKTNTNPFDLLDKLGKHIESVKQKARERGYSV